MEGLPEQLLCVSWFVFDFAWLALEIIDRIDEHLWRLMRDLCVLELMQMFHIEIYIGNSHNSRRRVPHMLTMKKKIVVAAEANPWLNYTDILRLLRCFCNMEHAQICSYQSWLYQLYVHQFKISMQSIHPNCMRDMAIQYSLSGVWTNVGWTWNRLFNKSENLLWRNM